MPGTAGRSSFNKGIGDTRVKAKFEQGERALRYPEFFGFAKEKTREFHVGNVILGGFEMGTAGTVIRDVGLPIHPSIDMFSMFQRSGQDAAKRSAPVDVMKHDAR